MKRKAKLRRAVRKRMAGLREPNGRLSRRKAEVERRTAETEREAMATAVEARMRVFGISEADARRQEGGTVIGRMYQAGKLTIDQMRAAERYGEVRNAYHRAIGAPSDTGKQEGGAGGSDYAAFCAGARRDWSAMMAALQAICQELRSPAPLSALDQFVVKDMHVSHMVGDLRVALNGLHRHFAMGRKVAA